MLFEQIWCNLDSSAAVTESRALQPNSKLIILKAVHSTVSTFLAPVGTDLMSPPPKIHPLDSNTCKLNLVYILKLYYGGQDYTSYSQ